MIDFKIVKAALISDGQISVLIAGKSGRVGPDASETVCLPSSQRPAASLEPQPIHCVDRPLAFARVAA